jgi:hypothetical protein
VVVNIGLLSAMYDEQRIHDEVAPQLLKLSGAIDALVQNADGGLVAVGSGAGRKASRSGAASAARRANPAHSLGAPDNRRRQGQAPA